jgi:hypothetical protein
MVTWLTRSLLFIVAGAVLAYAVTVRNDTIDLQTTGVILLLVGVFDLLVNFGLTMYMRQPMHHDEMSRVRTSTAPRPTAYRSPYPGDRAHQREPGEPRDDDTHATRPIRRDHPDWH